MSDRETRTAIPSNRVDLDCTLPGSNMYGVQPCPKCKSEFRWPQQGGPIICDDCGFTEPWENGSEDRP